MENFAPYSLAGDSDGAFNPADLNVGTHTLVVTGYSGPNLSGTPGPATTITLQVVDNSNVVPVLLTDPNSDHAVAFNAATFVREPFSLLTEQNFSSDKRTRVLIFVADFDALNSNTMSQAIVEAESSVLGTVSLPIEHVARVALFNWLTQIQVVLPESLADAGDLFITVRLHNSSTNPARLRIQQTSASATAPDLMNLIKDPWIVPDMRFLWPGWLRRQDS